MITVGDKTLAWRQGLTLADVVRELNLPEGYGYASLNGKLVRKKEWESTIVPDGATIRFRTIIAGG